METEEKELKEPKDKTLVCCECGNSFTWSSGEQLFYLSKGLATPKRCPKCRMIRKLTIARNKGVDNG